MMRIRRQARVARRVERASRRRRDPETARGELLDAAERVFARVAPEEAGLKIIAVEAGVSHALITHYFGTYAGLVEATLERRIRALRDRMMTRLRDSGALARPGELLGMLFDALEDPVHLRLMKWMVANERSGTQTLALQERGVQLIARQVAEALVPAGAPAKMIATIEEALATAVAAAFGWAMSKVPIAASIGRPLTPVLRERIQATLAGMVQSYLREAIGPMIPGGLPLEGEG